MSLVFVNLRWDAVDAERFEEIRRAVPADGELPKGCLSRSLRHQGRVLTATETWDTEVAGGRMNDLVAAVGATGVDRAPQTAMFSVPAIFAVAYRRPTPAAAPASGEATAPAVPQQRGADVRERIEEDAPAFVG